MRIEESEDRLQRDSKLYLDAVLPADAVWFHCPNGMSRKKSEAGRLKAHDVLAGVADWIIVYRGKIAFIELKTLRGRLSHTQVVLQIARKTPERNTWFAVRSSKSNWRWRPLESQSKERSRHDRNIRAHYSSSGDSFSSIARPRQH